MYIKEVYGLSSRLNSREQVAIHFYGIITPDNWGATSPSRRMSIQISASGVPEGKYYNQTRRYEGVTAQRVSLDGGIEISNGRRKLGREGGVETWVGQVVGIGK